MREREGIRKPKELEEHIWALACQRETGRKEGGKVAPFPIKTEGCRDTAQLAARCPGSLACGDYPGGGDSGKESITSH